jgi:hypothetical protein
MACDTTSNECLRRDCDECGGPIVITGRILLSREEVRRIAEYPNYSVEKLIAVKAENLRRSIVEATVAELASRKWQ